MRADRLISILMILHSRGRVRADDLAAELEVSTRTIYRDLDALSAAGIPVYAERGPGGGCALVEEYRASLAALTAEEVRSLFLISVPEPLRELGLGPTLQAAFRKLAGALPGAASGEKSPAARVYLDWSAGKRSAQAPFLALAYQASSQFRRLRVQFRLWEWVTVEDVVDPYGLVARGGEWLLVYSAHGRLRARPVSSMEQAELLDETFTLPEDFNLAAAWQGLAEVEERGRRSFSTIISASPAALPALRRRFGDQSSTPDEKGWHTLELSFSSFEEARMYLLGLGEAVLVLEPVSLRRSLGDFARRAARLYTGWQEIE